MIEAAVSGTAAQSCREMRILHVAETIKGGISTYLNQLVPLQTELLGEASVRVLVPEEHRDQLTAIAASCVSVFDRRERSLKGLLKLAASLSGEVRTFRPDIVHVHSTFAGAVARPLLGWRPGRPRIVYCPHGWSFRMEMARWKQRPFEIVEQALSVLCDRIVAISQHEADEAARIGISLERVQVIHNGLAVSGPPPTAATWDDARLKVLFVGRLDRQKGFDLLAAAVAGMPDHIHVRVAGAAILTAQIPVDSLPPNIEFLGWLTPEEIEGQLRSADLLAMPSRWEGFGLVALEAMRAGKPVVASAVGGIPEIVIDGVTGRLTPVNDIMRLREALMMDDAESRQRMGAQGRERFLKCFTLDRTHEQIMDLYRTLLTGKNAYQPKSKPVY